MAFNYLATQHSCMEAHFKPGNHALRKGRRSIPGQIYLITTTTKLREPLFTDFGIACSVSRVLGNPDTWLPHRCLCWVLMPDHWHGMLQLNGKEDLACVMRRAKLRSAHAARVDNRRQGGIWAPSFHDRALRKDTNVRATARYIIANPLRAGLVRNVLDYPYWDAVWLDPPTPDLLPSAPDLL